MGKTQEHSDDVRRKVVELHNSRNGHKKISKQLKIPISTIMAIIKKFKTTGDVKNQPGRGHVYIDPTHHVQFSIQHHHSLQTRLQARGPGTKHLPMKVDLRLPDGEATGGENR